MCKKKTKKKNIRIATVSVMFGNGIFLHFKIFFILKYFKIIIFIFKKLFFISANQNNLNIYIKIILNNFFKI
jgi:hypothetical protein